MDYYAVSSERYVYDPDQSHSDQNLPLDYTSAGMYASDQSLGGLVQPPFQATYTFLPYQPTSYDSAGNNAHYMQPSYSSSDPLASYGTELPLHAPIPLSSYTSLLGNATHGASISEPSLPADVTPPAPAPVPARRLAAPPLANGILEHNSPLDYYCNAPQVMFPTPCELLTNLTARERSGPADTQGADATQAEPAQAARKSKAADKQPENQRKAYFRAVADSVGFQPTDPDTITSHDKKRSYLECLEQYVQWLHEQIRLVGREPISIERVSTYRGLNSRSIRTLLVHMQDEIRKLNQKIAQEEGDYIRLQQHVLTQTGCADLPELRRHSIASCSVQEPAMFPTFVAAPQ
ncbi:hypothetical protein OBBRIDRAFT_501911 [Obba rivulosa]|uniref:Uncharacterized protein n=1 Tax=Obba rivulosa TaxID=1052685 RepID=A0A8E2DTZ4_9APHY|nr:hypothetical protein OBBRIDRAFT_501911 [Obba rivulosa]